MGFALLRAREHAHESSAPSSVESSPLIRATAPVTMLSSIEKKIGLTTFIYYHQELENRNQYRYG